VSPSLRFCLLSLLLGTPGLPVTTKAQLPGPRTRISINSNWRYLPHGESGAEQPSTADADWELVSVPHTWNAADPFDAVEGYRRGFGWYRKHLTLDTSLRGKRLFLYFEGANQSAKVYVNGTLVGTHKGGYTAFSFDATDAIRFDGAANDNLVAVQVDNSHDPSVPPLSVGYALYGGIYRDVWLIATDPVHFSVTDHASSGAGVTSSTDRMLVHATLVNDSPEQRTVRLVTSIFDAHGARVDQNQQSIVLAPHTTERVVSDYPPFINPHLWSPDDPFLYTVHSEIWDGDVLRDRVRTTLGFRSWRFTADSGFFFNGKRLVLRGTNRHQDLAGVGSAMTDDEHVRDMQWIKTMGANFVRLAHYPQDPAVLDDADRLGLLVWEEIPVVNYITVDSAFTANATFMMQDMIRQHRDHPSVIMWGLMNEVFLWSEQGKRIGRQVDTTYTREVRDFALHMDSVARAEDPTRTITMATHASADYDAAGLSPIPDVLGVNMYSGWYGGKFEDFGNALDNRHRRDPKRIFFVSEYGAEDDWRVNSLQPERFDFSGRWVLRFHESYLRQIRARPWLAGSAIWNQFDFSQPETGGSIPHMNQKGMLTWDRQAKDVFFLYKANWNREPMVHVATLGWLQRTGTDSTARPGAGKRPVVQPVDVYSNLGRVELFANGRSLGSRQPDDVKHIVWNVQFVDGDNVLEARGTANGRPVTDRAVVRFTYRAPTLADASVPFEQLGVNVGTHAQYADADGVVWVGDQPYRTGSFGYTGGEAKMFDKDLAIEGTRQPPMYFTYREGIESYRFDVPDGDYEVELRFAEPSAKPGQRVFDVAVNGRVVADKLDLAAQHGLARAVVIRTTLSAVGGNGIVATFKAVTGKAILNAIRVKAQ
jgi:beta-galactosidase